MEVKDPRGEASWWQWTTGFDVSRGYIRIFGDNRYSWPTALPEDEVVPWPHRNETPTIAMLGSRVEDCAALFLVRLPSRNEGCVVDYFQKRRGWVDYARLAGALRRGMGVHITIEHYIPFRRCKVPDYYRKRFDDLDFRLRALVRDGALSRDDASDVFKEFGRVLGGTLGKSARTSTEVYFTSNANEAYRMLQTAWYQKRDAMLLSMRSADEDVAHQFGNLGRVECTRAALGASSSTTASGTTSCTRAIACRS